MDSKISQIKQFFDEKAGNWDNMNFHDPKKLNMVVTMAQIPEGGRVLDLACGTGVLFPEILKRNPSELMGVDLSDAMIARAKEKFQDSRLRLIAADFFDLQETGFDVVTIYSAYPHFLDKDKLLHHVWETLKPGGRVLVAHTDSRHQINHRHSGGAHVQSVSSHLGTAWEESRWFDPYFTLDILADTPEFYLISGIKKER